MSARIPDEKRRDVIAKLKAGWSVRNIAHTVKVAGQSVYAIADAHYKATGERLLAAQTDKGRGRDGRKFGVSV